MYGNTCPFLSFDSKTERFIPKMMDLIDSLTFSYVKDFNLTLIKVPVERINTTHSNSDQFNPPSDKIQLTLQRNMSKDPYNFRNIAMFLDPWKHSYKKCYDKNMSMKLMLKTKRFLNNNLK